MTSSAESEFSDGLDDPTIAPKKRCRASDVDRSEAERGRAPISAPSMCDLPPIGTVIGDAELIGEIARGAMGVVYRARQRTLGRMVAVKMVLESDSDKERLHQRFDNEARAAASLDHPGIVPVYDVGRWNDLPYFTMALIDGQSLADVLREGPLPPRRAAQIALEVAEAISHAHDQQIIHRDLKPANILINHAGKPLVTDFGVSKNLGACSDLTTIGELIGTPHFMPPEQAGGSAGAVDATSDVYSMGAVLFSMLTGRPPFLAATPLDVVSQVLTQEPVQLRALNSTLPIELEVITHKCLQKSAKERYSGAQELAEDLVSFLAGEPIAARPPGIVQKTKLLFRHHVMFASVSGSVALLLILLNTFSMIALFRARSDVAELNDTVEVIKRMRTSERSAFGKVLREDAEALGQNDHFAVFEVERLVESSESYLETRPELAIQLAIAAVQTAQKNHLALPENMVAQIKHYVLESAVEKPVAEAGNADETRDARNGEPPEGHPNWTIEQWIEMANAQFPENRSMLDRELLGLPLLESPGKNPEALDTPQPIPAAEVPDSE